MAVAGYGVEIGQLRAAAEAAGSAADQARVVHPGAGLGSIATALPGGEAAKVAQTLATTFDQRTAGWADQIDQWSESVSLSAKTYSENEAAAEGAFGG
ncbi:hypothetical protein [Actinokineospora diospyrosa]|uniref:Excreted virulence factor EspC (Type VII ESX diderm) n=1 Tax=Actinokineospora diospyrosa TaxID=103728 RepID=A0ABT1IK59_9PSEU|nr:hypothetical protein [Actinokineospora diospyrosa]MCP2273045.1 hypothetical protein [Actinokineospora diospyrosa]